MRAHSVNLVVDRDYRELRQAKRKQGVTIKLSILVEIQVTISLSCQSNRWLLIQGEGSLT
jgi:hypothetical protein